MARTKTAPTKLPRPSDPARLESLRVENYRALKSVELKDIKPLTALVGPNGSGKSTVFDVFNFLSECFSFNLRHAWDRRGRARELKTRGQSGPITIELKYREKTGTPLITYHLTVDEEQGKVFVAEEWLSWRRGKRYGRPFEFLDYRRGEGSACVSGNCGNGAIDDGEQCDGANLNGQTCESQGFDSGDLACTEECRFDTAACVVALVEIPPYSMVYGTVVEEEDGSLVNTGSSSAAIVLDRSYAVGEIATIRLDGMTDPVEGSSRPSTLQVSAHCALEGDRCYEGIAIAISHFSESRSCAMLNASSTPVAFEEGPMDVEPAWWRAHWTLENPRATTLDVSAYDDWFTEPNFYSFNREGVDLGEPAGSSVVVTLGPGAGVSVIRVESP